MSTGPLVLGGILAVIGILFCLMAIAGQMRARGAHSSREVDGTVVKAEIYRWGIGGSRITGPEYIFTPGVRYEYDVANTRYVGERIDFGGGPQFWSESAAQHFLSKYTGGETVTALYNPDSPGESSLERSFTLPLWMKGAIYFLFLFSTIMFTWGVFGL